MLSRRSLFGALLLPLAPERAAEQAYILNAPQFYFIPTGIAWDSAKFPTAAWKCALDAGMLGNFPVAHLWRRKSA